MTDNNNEKKITKTSAKNNPATEKSTTTTQQINKEKSFPLGKLLIILAFLLSISAIYLGVLNWQTSQHISSVYGKLLSSQAQTNQEQQLEQQQHKADITKLKVSIDKISNDKTIPKTQTDWKIANAYYLSRLAFYNTNIARNKDIAIKLLTTAKQQLDDIYTKPISQARQALSNNIAALREVPSFDTEDVLQQIIAIDKQVKSLPLANPYKDVANKQKSAKTTTHKVPSSWEQGLDQTWQSLRKLVIIRHRNQPITPILAPNQQAYLLQNIHLLLQQAQWAVLQKQQKIYQSSLQQVTTAIKTYFNTDEQATQSILENVDKLMLIDVNPTLPSLTSVKLLQKIVNKKINSATSKQKENEPESATTIKAKEYNKAVERSTQP